MALDSLDPVLPIRQSAAWFGINVVDQTARLNANFWERDTSDLIRVFKVWLLNPVFDIFDRPKCRRTFNHEYLIIQCITTKIPLYISST
jgi:hypothetical protein